MRYLCLRPAQDGHACHFAWFDFKVQAANFLKKQADRHLYKVYEVSAEIPVTITIGVELA